MSLPMEVHAAIKKTFRSADERKKATFDSVTLTTHYSLSHERWDERSFKAMARDKGWATSTVQHRWGIFARMLAVLRPSACVPELSPATQKELESPPSPKPGTEASVVRSPQPPPKNQSAESPFLSEDDVKRAIQAYLIRDGWKCVVKWGQEHGTDIDATRDARRWIIEAKGQGLRSEMRVNYFLGALGETLQRMSEPEAKYSIAVPDIQQFRRLWERLPKLAKSRTGITALFVGVDGRVIEVP